MKDAFKKIDLITLALVIIVVSLGYCYAQLKVMGRDHIDFFGYSIFQVITGSMEDTIKINDIVIVKLTNDVDIQDIVTFRSNGDFVTHRVMEIDGEEIITKGDANNTYDEPITKEEIVGKVIYIVANVQVWSQVLRSPEVVLAIIVTLVVIKFLFAGNGHQKKKKKVKISKEDNND